MPVRTVRIPITIKIAMSIWLLLMALQAGGMITLATRGPINPAELAWRVAVFVCLGYQVYAASRFSRWSLVAHTLVYASVTLRRYLIDPDWTGRYPMLGVFVDIIPWALMVLLVAIHWRKMNWSPLGLPMSARAAAQAEDAEVTA